MRTALRWLRRAVLATVILAVAGAAGGYLWLRGSLPQIDGERPAYGLAAEVEVVRDRHGVPHILARSEDDALFALGYVHAQDRLWQMEMNRRIGAGRLAEVLGPPALDTDRLLRVLGLYRRAAATLAHIEPAARRRIDAYVNGVNAWLETRTRPLPPEFLILGFGPEPWTAADTLVWAKVMALDLGREWTRDLMRLRMAGFLTAERILDFYTPYREDKPRGVLLPGQTPSPAPGHDRPAPAASYRALPTTDGTSAPEREPSPPTIEPDRERSRAGFPFRDGSGHPGSNSWAVGGERSATGKPLLANDPHLGLTVPSVWYFAHLSWPGGDVVGATFPGMPLVVLGHNGRVAWGFTNTGADTQDLFLEKLDPENSARYLAPDGYRPFESHREVIRVKDGDDVVLRVRETRHGPVLDDGSAAAADAAPPGHVFALAWTALRDDDRTVEAGLGLPHARDWPSFVANLEKFHSPPLNVSYADVDGNIGFLVSGRVPIRPSPSAAPEATVEPGTPTVPVPVRSGTVPRPGWAAEHDWNGFVSFDALPRAYNPPGDAVVTANHAVTAAGYPHPLTFEWAAGYRAERIMAQIAGRPRHDLHSFRLLQQDRVSLFARALLPRLRRVALASGATPLARRARDLLETWDGDMDPDRPEPLVFNAWIWEFARLATADELGPVQGEAWGRKGAFVHRILESREIWCDDTGTGRTETCDELLALALERAVGRIAERHGDDPTAWRWGKEHVALAEHRPLASSPLAPLFNLRGPAPGSTYTVNAFEFSPLDDERPFSSTHGPSLRAIYDLSDLDRSLFVHSTGQSGNVLSPLYDNLEERWRNGDYVNIPTRREAFEEDALGRLRLVPR